MQLDFSIQNTIRCGKATLNESLEETASNIDMLFIACCEYTYADLDNNNKNFIINVKDTVIISNTFLTGTGARACC